MILSQPASEDCYAERFSCYLEGNKIEGEGEKCAILQSVYGIKTFSVDHSLRATAAPSTKNYDRVAR